MSTMITATGAEYHFGSLAVLDPNSRPVKIDDIAHMLAQINRFHGACKRPYSVAEHSLLCSEIARRAGLALSMQMCCLMHDAHECFTQDVASPVKVAVNFFATQSGGTAAWKYFEEFHAKHLRSRYGLSSAFAAHRHGIRHIDLVALATERRDLTAFDPDLHTAWEVLGDGQEDGRILPIDWMRLDTPEREDMTWKEWRQQFRNRFDELASAIALQSGLEA